MALGIVFAAGCGSDSNREAFDESYDSYFRSFSYDYNPAPGIEELAEQSTIVTRASLVNVEDGRFFGESEDQPEGVLLNLVFETDEEARYYVQITRPMDSSVDQLREVLPIGSTSVVYLQPNTDPIDEGWFNVRGDGNEWFFTTPQGWILDHPDRGIVFPLEDHESEAPFVVLPARTDQLDGWLFTDGT